MKCRFLVDAWYGPDLVPFAGDGCCATCGDTIESGEEWEPVRKECARCANLRFFGEQGERDGNYWREALAQIERIQEREAEELQQPVTETDLAALRALVENAEADALRTELGNVLAALEMLGARREDGSREARCPRGHSALVTARGRFRCSDPSCDLRTKDAVFRALVERE